MMSNCSRNSQKDSTKYSKLTKEEDSDQVGVLEDVVIVPSSGSIQGQSESLLSATLSPCYFCATIDNHRAEVKRIVEKGNSAKIETNFRGLAICTIKTPIGEKPMILRRYTQRIFQRGTKTSNVFQKAQFFLTNCSRKSLLLEPLI